MAGQLFSVSTEGGYMYSDNLSKYLRVEVQPRCKFRQFCDANDQTEMGLHRGDTARWNVYSKIANQGGRLGETTTMPESGFTISQKSLTVFEAGNSVPYTGRLDALAEHDAVTLIDKTLRDDCRKFHDIEAFNVFNTCKLRVAAATSTTSVVLTTNASTVTTNNVEFGTGHAKAIVDTMKERNIPPFYDDDYVAVTRPTTLRTFKNSLESIKQYTETGLGHIFKGEIGRYEATRYVEQTFIPDGGAIDSTTFSPATGTADTLEQREVVLDLLPRRGHGERGGGDPRGNPREAPGRLRSLQGHRLVLPRRLRHRSRRYDQQPHREVGQRRVTRSCPSPEHQSTQTRAGPGLVRERRAFAFFKRRIHDVLR
jgi:N4-gp56 family major capsid protein